MIRKIRSFIIRLLILIGFGFAVLPGTPRYRLEEEELPRAKDSPYDGAKMTCALSAVALFILLLGLLAAAFIYYRYLR